MKRKILFMIASLVLVACVGAITCAAVETGNNDTAHTLTSRLYEFCRTHKTEVTTAIGCGTLLVEGLISWHSHHKKAKAIRKEQEEQRHAMTELRHQQESMVGAVNGMIDGYNVLSGGYDMMHESYERYGATEADRNRIVGATLVVDMAILEIMTTVYANSKNLPQGVKDIINLKYANALKSLEDDTQIMAIVDAVRTNLSAGTKSEEEATPAGDGDQTEV